MKHVTTLDIKKLLTPISSKQASGIDIRQDLSPNSIYYQIKDARSSARTKERRRMEGETAESPLKNWHQVHDLAIKILISYSKDLEVCTWLCEALLRIKRFYGLKEGFTLIHNLIKKYWKSIYPKEDEDGILTKVSPLTVLNGDTVDGTLIVPIYAVPITEGITCGPYTLWEYQQALKIDKITDKNKRERQVNELNISLKDIQAAVSETDPNTFESLHNDITATIEQYNELNHLLNKYCGENAPPCSNIKRTLDNYLDHLKMITPGRKRLNQKNELPLSPSLINEAKTSNSNAMIKGRSEALNHLLEISEFFKKTEPHSPLPYLLERAVKWANLPFPELLKELVDNENERKKLFNLTGIE